MMVPASFALAETTASFRYPLSNFTGPVPSQWAKLAVDPERNEIYALNQYQNDIRIFDEHGMEIYSFGEEFVSATDIAIGDDGDVYVLTKSHAASTLHLCDYRGEPTSEIELKNLPAEFSSFRADRLVYAQGVLYLVDSGRLLVAVVDSDGSFKRGHDLDATLKQLTVGDKRTKEKRLADISMHGFDVDKNGNMLFTVPTLFSAFRMSADGELEGFGRAGSGPGKFGVTGGIVADAEGRIYVSDRLRCVVLIFDENFEFQSEFGFRGDRPSNLIVPDDLAIDNNGNVYVAQAANRGVSVFSVTSK